MAETGTSTTSPEAGTQPSTESSTTSTPSTQTETSTPSTDVNETKDKEGNTVLSSTIKDVTITAIAATQSIKEDIGIPEVAQKVAKQVANENKKDYNRGLVEGIKFAFRYGEEIGKKSNEITEQQSKFSPEQINASRSLSILVSVSHKTQNKSDAYIIGYSRGLTIGADFVTTTGLAGIPHKQLHPNQLIPN